MALSSNGIVSTKSCCFLCVDDDEDLDEEEEENSDGHDVDLCSRACQQEAVDDNDDVIDMDDVRAVMR